MHIEIREDSVVITGYVNAVERYSKPIKESLHGKVRTFIERSDLEYLKVHCRERWCKSTFKSWWK